MLTTGCVVFSKISVSVDELEAVPMLCVKQLVSTLLCMNAWQNVIISIRRNIHV